MSDYSKYIYSYTKDNYYTVKVYLPRDMRDGIKARASTRGESVNAYITALIRADLASAAELSPTARAAPAPEPEE